MTGLPQRVIRVWFQNKRCKDKKRSIALKQQQQQKMEQQQMRNGEGGEQQNSGQQKQQNEASNSNDGPNTSDQPINGTGQNSNQTIDQSMGYLHQKQQQPAWKA